MLAVKMASTAAVVVAAPLITERVDALIRHVSPPFPPA
jgi:hypothetical protein